MSVHGIKAKSFNIVFHVFCPALQQVAEKYRWDGDDEREQYNEVTARVTLYEFYDLEDMNNLKVDKSKTEAGYKRNSFIYKFMSSMRQKINDPLGQRAKKRKDIMKR